MNPTWTPGEPPKDGQFYVVYARLKDGYDRWNGADRIQWDDIAGEWVDTYGMPLVQGEGVSATILFWIPVPV